MKKRSRSLFVGKTVPLVDGGRPLLYPRCHDVDEALVSSGSELDLRKVALGERVRMNRPV